MAAPQLDLACYSQNKIVRRIISFCLRQFFAALKMEINFYMEKFFSKERNMASSTSERSNWKSGFRQFFIELDSIHNSLFFDFSLNVLLQLFLYQDIILPTLIANHFLSTNLNKMFSFERSITGRFFNETVFTCCETLRGKV